VSYAINVSTQFALAANANYNTPTAGTNPYPELSAIAVTGGGGTIILQSNSIYYLMTSSNSTDYVQYIGWQDAVNAN
jgi:hypothetical protein